MKGILKPDPLGAIDITSAILVFLTQSFMPAGLMHLHAGILLTKGSGTVIRPVKLPFPVYVIGGMADVLSAAILYTGTPPILVEFKGILAAILLLKGFWSLFGFLKM